MGAGMSSVSKRCRKDSLLSIQATTDDVYCLCRAEILCLEAEIRALETRYSWLTEPKVESGNHFKGCWELFVSEDVPDGPCPCHKLSSKLKRIKELQQRLKQQFYEC